MNIQSKWDKYLISAWYDHVDFGYLMYKFLLDVNPTMLRENPRFSGGSKLVYEFNDLSDFINSVGLKRCLDNRRNKDGSIFYVCGIGKKQVRAHIAEHSKNLNAALWSNSVNRIEILLNIENYKWVNRGTAPFPTKAARSSRRKNKTEVSRNVMVRQRGLTDAGWRTVS